VPAFAQATHDEYVQPIYPSAKTGFTYMYNYYFPPAGSSTPWWPSWSPDGKSLAFAMAGSIWTVRVGESAAREIAYAKQYLSSPEWSPDGRWLVYTAEDFSQSINLILRDLQTGRTVPLTSGRFINVDPAWSPDGKRLAFVTTEPNGYFNIRVMDIDNGQKGNGIAVTTDHRFGRDRLYFGDYDEHIAPTWSPDGKELIFVSNRGIPLGSGALWRAPVELDVMNRGRAHKIYQEETLYRSRPNWAPDGKRIIYSSHLGGQYNNLFVLPVEGGDPYKMTFGDYDSFQPRWSPDGEWIAYISNQEGLPQLKLLKGWGGKQILVKPDKLAWSRPMGRVEVEVIDAATGRPTAARIYAQASDGKPYTPPDSYERVSTLNKHLFHTYGRYTCEVPTGPYSVEAIKGFEYDPVEKTVQIQAGATQHIRLTLQRARNWKSLGWHSGSNHVHMNYGGNLHNTPQNLYFMNDAEDADVIGHQIANKDNRILDYQYFMPGGGVNPVSTSDRILVSGEEYRPPFLGHISLFNLTDHLISPFLTGYEGTGVASLYPSNTDIFLDAKMQGGIGAYVHPWNTAADPLDGDLGSAKGFPVDLALDAFSYLELWSAANKAVLIPWHHALNLGFKVPVTGGEDSISNLHRTRLVAAVRGYFLLDGQTLTWPHFMAAMLKGRGFVSNGPLLDLRINGRMPGDGLQLASPETVGVHALMESIVPLDHLQLVYHGSVVEEIPLSGDRRHAEFSKQLQVAHSGWFTLQAFANKAESPVEDNFPMATTNAIYVSVGNEPVRDKQSAEYFIRWIDKLTVLASSHPGWRSEKEKSHVLGQFRQARDVFVKLDQEAQREPAH
jgi:dipeptidyl aminopeptidase/acylaminoacyl peptidase